MRIAVFTPYLPYPADTGGKIRSYHLLRALALRFQVDVYTVHYGEGPSHADRQALEQFCHRVHSFRLDKTWRTRDRLLRVLAPLPRSVDFFLTPAALEEARGCLSSGGYDLVLADEICMTPYAELAPHLPRIVSRQKPDYLHYREMALARPWGLEKVLDFIEAAKLRRYERDKMPLYQAFLACTEADAAIMRRDAPGSEEVVVPNGADLSAFVPSAGPGPQRPVLLYVGAMHYYPNIDAVQYFFSSMFERIRQVVPDVQVQIVGHSPPAEIQQLASLPGVEVTGSVPDMRPYYEKAMVFVLPLRLGGGTRLKIVEAMAMGMPIVSTSVGAEGLEVRSGENVLLADDPDTFVAAVLRLLADPDLRQRIGEGGQSLARRYDWQELTKPFVDMAETVARQWRGGSTDAHRLAD